MSETIALHYKGCKLVAGMTEGGPVAYVHHDGRELVRIEGDSVIDCAHRAQLRIDQMQHGGFHRTLGEAPVA